MRLDVYLVKEGFAETRQRAVYLIEQGKVTLDGRVALKASAPVDGKTVSVTGEGLRYVSRGGLKLERALKAFAIDPADRVCLDLGASTGGFTDCLLQNGAKKVYALDVGRDQLDAKLRNDRRVISIEAFNARQMNETTLPEKIGLAVSDLSFISQKLIYRPLTCVLQEGAQFISLVKPQFEAGKEAVGKNGIVKDLRAHERVICELIAAARAEGLYIKDLAVSPIRGGDGNKEYLALFLFGVETAFDTSLIGRAVYEL